ncbi:methyl-accepting chemotaxis protein [Acidiphilium sp.]|uniref:methyl-accepting chemotaxis protein n=1 Tax=Acidiphilium sp. TaxID=527 RepID=UPI003D028E3F
MTGILTIIAGIIAIGGCGFVVMRLWLRWRLAPVCDHLAAVVERAAEHERTMLAQNALAQNIDMLRSLVEAHGEPRLEGEVLWFGNRRINGDFEIVDQVKAKFGGAATIFARDQRVATNIFGSSGTRAVGTTLAAGPVYDRMFGQGLSYRGATEILGEAYLAVYEPILQGSAVIGVLFVGVKSASVVGSGVATVSRKPCFKAIAANIDLLETIAAGQVTAAEQAIVKRQEADDISRRLTAERHAAARGQAIAIDAVARGLEQLDAGDLTYRIEGDVPEQYAKLVHDFNGAMARLQAAMAAIAASSAGVRAGASEITQASDDLARRTEQQAATLEQTAAAMDEITATVQTTARRSSEARDLVSAAGADAKRSGEVVFETVNAMSAIERSSRQIDNIVGLIDEIAFQTNLLALNAGIEAARAGDAGRGFAVVATEVRALAQRSADAAKEIQQLISASGQQVGVGVRLVGETGKSLERIAGQVAQMNLLITDIAASAQEQSTGLHQINTAVNQMDQVTQQNAAMVEQATAASHGLAGEAAELARQVEQFIIADTGAKPVISYAGAKPVSARSEATATDQDRTVKKRMSKERAIERRNLATRPFATRPVKQNVTRPAISAKSPAKLLAVSSNDQGWEEF